MKSADRRGASRVPHPSCPTCRAPHDKVKVTSRTAFLLYFKCGECGRVWQLDKPSPRGQRRWDR